MLLPADNADAAAASLVPVWVRILIEIFTFINVINVAAFHDNGIPS